MFNKNYRNRRYWYKSRLLSFIFFIIDIIGYSIIGFKRNFKRISYIKTIGIIVTDHIGDAILTTPIFKVLKEYHPNMKIILICTEYNSVVFKEFPYIDRKIIISNSIYSRGIPFWEKISGFYELYVCLKQLKLDAIVDLRGDFISILLMAIAGIKQRIGFAIGGFGFLLTNIVPFKFNPDYIKNFSVLNKAKFLIEFFDIKEIELKPYLFIKNEINDFDKSYLIIHPGAGDTFNSVNQIPPDLFYKILNFLLEYTELDIVITGKSGELNLEIYENHRIKNCIGKTNFVEFVNLISNSRFIISGSTSAIHIAYAYDIPVFGIFSMRDSPFLWFYPSVNNMMVFKFTKCALCERNYCNDKECLQFNDNFLFFKLKRFLYEKVKYRMRF